MKKRLLILLISVLTVVSAVAVLSACGEDDGGGVEKPPVEYKPGDSLVDDKDVEYEVTEGNVTTRYKDKKYEITYLMENASYLTLTGAKANELTLSGYAGDVQSIVLSSLEENIKIGEEPISIAGVAADAFRGCESLTAVDLTKKNASVDFAIGAYAFAYCPNVTKVVLPTNIYTNANSIGNFAFYNASKLTSVTIGDRFATIGEGSFAYCSELTSIEIPDRVSVIERGAFTDCEKLATVKWPGQLKSIQDFAFKNTALKEASFGSGVRYIGGEAFYGTQIASIKLPASVTYIGDRAFYNCYDLTATEIPFIGNALNTPSAYTAIYGVDEAEEAQPLADEPVAGEPMPEEPAPGEQTAMVKNRTVKVTGTGAIPDASFKDCDYITELNIAFCEEGKYRIYESDGVTFDSVELKPNETIGASAFYGCKALQTVSVPAVKSVGDGAFYGCKALTAGAESEEGAAAEVPGLNEGLLTIGRQAYAGCALLTSVVIPSTVTSVGDGAFADCAGLKSLEVKSYSSVLTTGEGFDKNHVVRSLAAVSSFFGSTTAYEETYSYNNGEKVYDYGPMYKAGGRYVPDVLTTVRLGALYSVPQNMFNGWVSLATVELDFKQSYSNISLSDYVKENPRTIGSNAFYGCKNLASLTVKGGGVVSGIGSNAFANCAKLPFEGVAAFTAPKSIDANAFAGCAEFTEVTIPSTVTSLAPNVFYECPNITKLTVEAYSYQNNYTYANSFGAVYNLFGSNQLSADSTLYTMAYGGVYVPVKLKTVTLGNVYALADNAFRGMNKLTDVSVKFTNSNFSSQINSVGNSAFYGCESLTSLKLDSGTKNLTIGSAAFQNCFELTELEVRAENYPKGILSGCNSLAKLSINIPSSLNSSYAIRLGEFFTTNSVSNTSHASYVTASLKTVKLLNGSSTEIRSYMFYDCKNLENVEFDGIDGIGQNAFYGCEGLDTVTAGGIVTYKDWIVGLTATSYSYVRAVVIPATVKGVGNYVFDNASYLNKVYYKGTASEWSSLEKGYSNSYLDIRPVFLTTSNSLTNGKVIYYVDPGSSETPKTASVIYIENDAAAAEIKSSVTIGGVSYDVTAVATNAGYNQNLRYVYIPLTVTNIGSNAFVNNSSLRLYYAGTSSEWNAVSSSSSLSYVNKTYETEYTTRAYTFKDGTKTLKTVNALFAENYEPVKAGYKFAGWYTDSLLTSGTKVSFPYYGTADTTFYAKWTEIYTVKFVSNGGTSYADKTVDYGTTISLLTPVKAGYRFDGWYVSYNFSGKKYTSNYYVYDNTTLYAKWTKNT